MTAAARRALADLEAAHDLLENEERIEAFRVLWVGAIAICRAIGHVLQKVDAASSPKMARAIDAAYRGWKTRPQDNPVFFEFVEEERNAVLKEYEFGFLSGPVELVVAQSGEMSTLGDNLFVPLSQGRFAGEDCRDVLGTSIEWWHSQLDLIDEAAAT